MEFWDEGESNSALKYFLKYFENLFLMHGNNVGTHLKKSGQTTGFVRSAKQQRKNVFHSLFIASTTDYKGKSPQMLKGKV